jgi:hypothetical protein
LRGAAPAGRLPVYLIATDAYERMIAKYRPIECSARVTSFLAMSPGLVPRAGTLTFTVPDIAPSQYYFEVEMPLRLAGGLAGSGLQEEFCCSLSATSLRMLSHWLWLRRIL